jgi:hypothetical protein
VSRSGWPVVGTAIVVGGMHYAYVHAARAGKGEPPPTFGENAKAKEGRYGFAR